VAVTTRPEYERDPRVDDYIKLLPAWQQKLCRQLRGVTHAADPEIAETIKRTVQPYFVLEGNVCALLAAKDHVNVFLYDRASVPDPEGIITGGHNNKAARMISFYQGDTINAPALTAMLKHIIADNRAKRSAKPKSSCGPMPASRRLNSLRQAEGREAIAVRALDVCEDVEPWKLSFQTSRHRSGPASLDVGTSTGPRRCGSASLNRKALSRVLPVQPAPSARAQRARRRVRLHQQVQPLQLMQLPQLVRRYRTVTDSLSAISSSEAA
jgi:hypothetical protein